ncbi:MAG: FAD-dependent oxidoreductase, partial [Gammaproteobacteria bacterium]
MPVTPRLDSLARRADLSRMHGEAFDVIVIGGGITGAGIARACALKGLRVALVEAADFAEGTSSRSTKLIHGGLR